MSYEQEQWIPQTPPSVDDTHDEIPVDEEELYEEPDDGEEDD